MRTYLGDISVLGCVGFRSKELKNPEYKNYRYGHRLSDIRLRTYLGLISVLDSVSLDPRPPKNWIRLDPGLTRTVIKYPAKREHV